MRHAGNQLADRGHLFTVQELLLRFAQIVVSLPRLFVQQRPLNRMRCLTANRNQQIHVRRRELARRARANDQRAHHSIFRPEDHEVGRDDLLLALCFPKDRRQRQALHREKRRVDSLDVM